MPHIKKRANPPQLPIPLSHEGLACFFASPRSCFRQPFSSARRVHPARQGFFYHGKFFRISHDKKERLQISADALTFFEGSSPLRWSICLSIYRSQPARFLQTHSRSAAGDLPPSGKRIPDLPCCSPELPHQSRLFSAQSGCCEATGSFRM